MAKRKHPRLPNGFGSIRYMGKGRSNPYAVYPPEHAVTNKGYMTYKRALCYVPDWYTGFAVLVSYKAGTYRPGDELKIRGDILNDPNISVVAQRIIDDYKIVGRKREEIRRTGYHLLLEEFNAYYDERFGEFAYDKFSAGTARQYASTFKRFECFYDKYIEEITVQQIQNFVNEMSKTYSKNYIDLTLQVLKRVYKYAIRRGHITNDITASVKIPISAREEKHAIPYTQKELDAVWEAARAGHPTAISVLIQVHTGFRVGAFRGLVIDIGNETLTGGVKSGTRTIPIHPAILPFVNDRKDEKSLILVSADSYEKRLKDMCEELGIERHTSHSGRHTFKMLCDRYGVNPIACRILMGHSIKGGDIHDAVYTHFELDDLRREIQKIKI